VSASTAGAIKAFLEARGLGVSVFRDEAPKQADGSPHPLPYVTVAEAISIVRDPAFNSHDDPAGHVIETAQIDVWQSWRDATTRAVAESYTLGDAVALALAGARLPSAPTHTPGVHIVGIRRLLEPAGAPTVVHHAITVEIRRQLARTGA